MRTVLLLASCLLLTLTACAPPSNETPATSPPPTVSDATPATSAPATDAFAELVASVEDAEDVVTVEGFAYATDPATGVATIVVDDGIERNALQPLVESLIATADDLGLDLGGSDVRVQTETAETNRPLVWLGDGLPADLTAAFDAWQWLDELDGGERPIALLYTTDDRPSPLLSTDVDDATDEGLATFIAGVTEGGEMAGVLTSSPIELAIAATPDATLCSQVIVSGAPLSEQAATLLTSIVTEGFEGRAVCFPFTSTADGTFVGNAHEVGGTGDEELQTRIVGAFEAVGVQIG